MKGYNSTVFFIVFVVLLFGTGTIWGIAVCSVCAAALSFVYRKLTNTSLGVPPNSAVLITGCSTGIGLDSTYQLAQLGFTVFAGVRKLEDGQAIKVQCTNTTLSAKIIPVILDVTKKEQLDESYNIIKNYLQTNKMRLVAVVNNAGFGEVGPVECISLPKFRKQFDINVFGSIAVSQKYLPLLREAGECSPKFQPRLLFLSWFSMPLFGAYSATKFSIEAIADAMRVELKSFQIHVAVITPGMTRTSFVKTSEKAASDTWNEILQSESDLSPKAREVYGNMFQGLEEHNKDVAKRAVPVSVATKTVVSAILDSRPLPRYFSGMECSYGIPILVQFPEGITDFIFSKTFKQ